ncbi:MAG TPA: VOC family protein [Burkholderiales bacterium]|nr:VOC family protein [Burkholderiales bacterium]
MIRLDHLAIAVSDWRRSRDWYVEHLGLELEFEVPERGVAALRDDFDTTLFVSEPTTDLPLVAGEKGCILTMQVDDVEATCRRLAGTAVDVVHPPRRVEWGYGAEVRDPDGYRIRLWDAVSMREKGGG